MTCTLEPSQYMDLTWLSRMSSSEYAPAIELPLLIMAMRLAFAPLNLMSLRSLPRSREGISVIEVNYFMWSNLIIYCPAVIILSAFLLMVLFVSDYFMICSLDLLHYCLSSDPMCYPCGSSREAGAFPLMLSGIAHFTFYFRFQISDHHLYS